MGVSANRETPKKVTLERTLKDPFKEPLKDPYLKVPLVSENSQMFILDPEGIQVGHGGHASGRSCLSLFLGFRV